MYRFIFSFKLVLNFPYSGRNFWGVAIVNGKVQRLDKGKTLGILNQQPVFSIYLNSLNFSEFLLCMTMAIHSSTLAWKIPWTEEHGRLQSMGSRRVGHNWATSLSLFTFMHWRRKWQPTPVFLPGESQGWGSLVGCCLWGHTELDTTEAT